jgi:hypothetical protein
VGVGVAGGSMKKKLDVKKEKNGSKAEKKQCFIKKFLYEALVFIFFVLIHIPSLGNDNFNTDVWKWKARSQGFGNGITSLQFKDTLQTYHPGVILMWAGSVGSKINNFIANSKGMSLLIDDDVDIVFQLDFIQKLVVVIIAGVSISFIFYVLKNLFSVKHALLSVVLLSLEPFYLGLTRVFHLEGLVSTFMLASVLWLYYFFQDSSKKSRLILSAIFAGFAVLTKTSALFLVLFCGLVVLIYVFLNGKYCFKNKSGTKNLWKNLGTFLKAFGKIFLPWFGVSLIVFFILWPAMWVIPGQALSSLFTGISDVGVEGDHIQFYFGKLVEDPGFSFYFVVLALRSSAYLLIGFIGSFIIRKKLPENIRNFVNFLLIFVFFYFIQLIIPTKKLDRYILPALVVISLISSTFYVWVFEKLSSRKTWEKVLSFVIFIFPAIYTCVLVHPDYLSYFNPMFGGLKTGMKVIEPKWIVGEREITNYFDALAEEEGDVFSTDTSFKDIVYKQYGVRLKTTMTVGFQEKYYTQIWPFFRQKGNWAVVENLTPYATKTKYFVYPVWDDVSGNETRVPLRYFDTIFVRDVPMYNVYKNEGEGVHNKK